MKITRSLLKQEGWDIREYQHLATENNHQQYEFERGGFANTELRQSFKGTEGKGTEGKGKDKKGKRKNNDDTPTERKV